MAARPLRSAAFSAAAYQQQNGLPSPTNFSGVAINRSATQAIANSYARMPSFDKTAIPAYRAMAEETGRQFDHITKPRSKGGMGLDIEATNHDPYGDGKWEDTFPAMGQDIENNNRLKVLSTAATGGHPFFSNDQNDMFRAVHDTFGHLAAGRGVDKHGEEAAYQKHSQMYSPLARGAMATETRGQNAALHSFGGFPEQKVGILPAHMQLPDYAGIGDPQERAQAVLQARQWNVRQGIT